MKTYWYLTRASGAVALILLTLSLIVGISAIGRVHSRRWPRFAIDGVHRTSSLLAIVFLLIHIATAVLDSFAPISLLDSVVPFVGAYRPLWLGFGATAFDLLLAVAITSGLRQRLGYRPWRAVHWLAYGAWPIAVLHGLGTGSDATQRVDDDRLRRLRRWRSDGGTEPDRDRLAGRDELATHRTGGDRRFGFGVAIWLPNGPLAPHWARRAGTPTKLLRPTVFPRRRA